MKKLLLAFVILASLAFASSDPWEDYNDDRHGEGHEHHPVVPEPSTYGAFFIAASGALVAYRKFRKK